MKSCTKCGQQLSEDRFHKRTYKSGNVGLQSVCKDCGPGVRKKYYRKHSAIKYRLGLTWEQVEELTAPGKCEVCGSTESLCIDHCHSTGKPRGLLCHKCNTALGLVDDDAERLINLSQWLERSKQSE